MCFWDHKQFDKIISLCALRFLKYLTSAEKNSTPQLIDFSRKNVVFKCYCSNNQWGLICKNIQNKFNKYCHHSSISETCHHIQCYCNQLTQNKTNLRNVKKNAKTILNNFQYYHQPSGIIIFFGDKRQNTNKKETVILNRFYQQIY